MSNYPSLAGLFVLSSIAVAASGDVPESTSAVIEQAFAAHTEAESLAYEKPMAERTIKSSQITIDLTAKTLRKTRDSIATKTEEVKALEAELAEATSAGDEPRRAAAEKALRQKRLSLDVDVRVEPATEERLKKAEETLATAMRDVPLKETAAKDARRTADDARVRAIEADRARAATQNPHRVAERIDALIDAKLAEAKLTPSPQADDATFLRRAALDITGVIPKYDDVTSFLDDVAADKRSRAVDRLLAEPSYGRNFAERFCAVTTENGTSTLGQGRDTFRDWLTEGLNLNRGWDRIVTEMIAAEGKGYAAPGALFTVAYRMNEQPDPALLLAAAGDYFLGLQIQCVQCHDHPYHEWKHEQFWGMAAMFGRVRVKGPGMGGRELEFLVSDEDADLKDLVRMNGIKYADQAVAGRMAIPDPVNAGQYLKTVSAQFLDDGRPELPEKGNYRTAFARWVTSKENPYFARATVNRLWAHFFGRGLVEPILNLHSDNAPSHPELLDLLAEEFRQSEYDLKYVVRTITATRAYQRSSKPTPDNEKDDRLLSHMAVKPLDSYVLVDSLATALGRTPPTGTKRRDDAEVFDTRLPGGDPKKYTHGIPQVLKLMNAREHADFSGTAQKVTRNGPPNEAIEQLYLAVLSRRPSEGETADMVKYVGAMRDSRQGYSDVFWVLLNSAEFLVNH